MLSSGPLPRTAQSGPPPVARISPLAHASHGFTLVEMMVTITILIIALGVSVPSISSWIHQGQLNAASQSLQSALRAAQSHAQAQSRVVALILTNTAITSDTLTPAQIRAPLTHWAIYATPLNGSDESSRLLQVGTLHSNRQITATLNDSYQAVCFNSLGRLSRQDLSGPIEKLACAPTAELTLTHHKVANKTVVLSVNTSGKTHLTP